MIRKYHNQGFTLLEVLIAFVILIVGLLGATALVLRTAKINVEARQYDQVAMLTNGMIEKMRIVKQPLAFAEYGRALSSATVSVAKPQCLKSSKCTAAERAQANMYEFDRQLRSRAADFPAMAWGIVRVGTNFDGANNNYLYELEVTWGGGTDITTNRYIERFVITL